MEIKWIQSLVRLMTKADLSELEIEDQKQGLRVHLRRGQESAGPGPLVQVVGGGGAAPAPVATGPVAASAPEAPGLPPDTQAFNSPMVGTFYRSPSPDSDPFVSAGTRVEPDTVICIIEAMKVMNEIKAELRGEIVEVLVDNGEPVEFGQPLFLVKN